jgi:hypothetical protein
MFTAGRRIPSLLFTTPPALCTSPHPHSDLAESRNPSSCRRRFTLIARVRIDGGSDSARIFELPGFDYKRSVSKIGADKVSGW